MHGYARRNISGSRSMLNNVSEVNMTAGSNVCPVSEYVTKAMTEARTGMLIATALFAERIKKSDRMYL